MKKTTLLFVMAALCQNFNGQAQLVEENKPPYQPLIVGDRVPSLTFNNVINTDKKSISFSDFKGKAIILDFWATWCGSCIANMPHMMELQKKFGSNLQILALDNSSQDGKEKILTFLENKKGTKYEITVPIIYLERTLNELFPKKVIPHYVWIGPDGRVKAITGSEEATEVNVARLVAGLKLNLAVKER
ncbi:TlpA family protein disulfide reductase [Pedobacter sp. MW01-1-1]|uniref:TlpA family protein disulfide reductase n=1 Tax=Pedobacter sp. MW01-1-1 TaxID=3383027 RepID=UPI003FEE36D7